MNKREPRTVYVCIYPSISLSWSSSSSQTGRSGHDKRARRDEKVQDWSMTRLEKKILWFPKKIIIIKFRLLLLFCPSLHSAPVAASITRGAQDLCYEHAAQEYLEEKCLLKPIAGPLFWLHETMWLRWLHHLLLCIQMYKEGGNRRIYFRRALMHRARCIGDKRWWADCRL
jgi:hypothetical protein